jgi:hypothetical protein
MPNDLLSFARGKASEIFVSDVFALGAIASEPTDVTITVGTSAAAGDTEADLRVAAGTLQLRKNLILAFDDGATVVLLRVTEDTVIDDTASTVPVDAVAGDVPGLPGALTTSHVALWDRLHRVLGTETAGFQVADNVNQLTPASYEAAFAGAVWDEDEATSKGWSIPRQGRFKAGDHALRQCETANLEEREVWVKVVYAREDGQPGRVYEGRARVRNLQIDPPATGVLDASWTWQGQGRPKRTDLGDTNGGSGS